MDTAKALDPVHLQRLGRERLKNFAEAVDVHSVLGSTAPDS